MEEIKLTESSLIKLIKLLDRQQGKVTFKKGFDWNSDSDKGSFEFWEDSSRLFCSGSFDFNPARLHVDIRYAEDGYLYKPHPIIKYAKTQYVAHVNKFDRTPWGIKGTEYPAGTVDYVVDTVKRWKAEYEASRPQPEFFNFFSFLSFKV